MGAAGLKAVANPRPSSSRNAGRGGGQRRRLHHQGHAAAPGRDPGPRLVHPVRRQPEADDRRARPFSDRHAAGDHGAKARLSFRGEDVYLNVAGGLAVDEPAADLGAVLAVVSCLKNKPLPREIVVFGEVGLSGEIRSVGAPVARIKEALSLGFETVILPQGNVAMLEKEDLRGTRLLGVQNIREALPIIF